MFTLTETEIRSIISLLEEKAGEYRSLDLTPFNWVREFGEHGLVNTPIGIVKMGDNQYEKLLGRGGRSGKLGLIKPTLENPALIIEDAGTKSSIEDVDRPWSYVFVKSFKKAGQERVYFFTTVTVQKGNCEVVISCQEKKPNRISALLKEGKLTYVNFAATPSSAVSSVRGDQPVEQHGATSSVDKDI